jgi:hypothetical protein
MAGNSIVLLRGFTGYAEPLFERYQMCSLCICTSMSMVVSITAFAKIDVNKLKPRWISPLSAFVDHPGADVINSGGGRSDAGVRASQSATLRNKRW